MALGTLLIVDIAPTDFSILNTSQPSHHPGYSAHHRGARPMTPIYTGPGYQIFGFVDGPWKFIHDFDTHRSELFDLRTDPGEYRSLTNVYPARVNDYLGRARSFLEAQRLWQKQLPDLVPLESDRDQGSLGERITWRVDLRACSFSPRDFDWDAGRLKALKEGPGIIRCTRTLPPGRGRLVQLRIAGRDAIGGAWIEGSVQARRKSGTQPQNMKRQHLASCMMNGAKHCIAAPPAGVGRFEGGELELDLRYVMLTGLPKRVADFHLRGAVVTYRWQSKRSEK